MQWRNARYTLRHHVSTSITSTFVQCSGVTHATAKLRRHVSTFLYLYLTSHVLALKLGTHFSPSLHAATFVSHVLVLDWLFPNAMNTWKYESRKWVIPFVYMKLGNGT